MKRIIGKIIILILAAVLFAAGYFYLQFEADPSPSFAITFSQRYANYLGFDAKQMYIDILNDLKPAKIRLMAYWEEIEPFAGQYNYQIMDEYLIEAGKRNIEVILVLGQKQPRWPECHHPDWLASLTLEEKDKRLLAMVDQAVRHFQQFDAVKIWQIENEPYFEFGSHCPKLNPDLVRQELELIRKSDNRPVMLTDSGETGGYWLPTAKLGADVLGVTMYRTVYNRKFGYYKYPLPPSYYRLKAGIVQTFSDTQKIAGIELQAEPWFIRDITETGLSEQLTLMNPKVFRANVNYAKKVGFEDNYLWGVEWWYWLAKQKGDWGMWEEAKKLLAE